MTTTVSAEDRDKLCSFLAATPLFSELDREAVRALSAHLKPVQLPAGAILIRQGEAADAVYVVVNGRLRVIVSQNEGEFVVGEIGRGEVVGEMGLLTDEPRSATVRALRDSYVLKLSKPEFLQFIEAQPTALFGITRLIIGRLQRSLRSTARPSSVRTLAVVPAGEGADLLRFSERLANALGDFGATILINRERLSSQLRHRDAISYVGERMLIKRERLSQDGQTAAEPHGSELNADTTQWLHNIEATQDIVIYQSDPEPSPWTDRCLRQADRILLVAQAHGQPALSRIEEEMVQRELLRPGLQLGAKKDLVLLHRNRIMQPEDTAKWLSMRRIQRHHHVCLDSKGDFQRLARVLTDRQVGLVLSGGGARGVAHVGVMRALEECQIPIDAVGGTSFGALMAAGPAVGWDSSRLREEVKRALVDTGRPVDYTMPLIALTKGEKATVKIRKTFGDQRIEDLWLPYFCLSSNLTRGNLMIHTAGPLWQAIRASVAVPGIFPPVRSGNEEVLVDGGIMNNLPVDIMRSLCEGGKVLAVNLRGEVRMPAGELSEAGVVSGWSLLTRRLNPFGRRPVVPGIIEVILRSVDTGGSLATMRNLEKDADLVFNPPVSEFGLLEFNAYEKLIEVGYRHAMERLANAPSDLRHPAVKKPVNLRAAS